MTMIIDGTNGLTFPDTSKQYNSYYSFKNRIINGAMDIDQRNAGASVGTGSGNDVYTLDRWQAVYGANNKYTIQRSTTTAAGFINSLLVTSSAATATSAGDIYHIGQTIEGFNVSDLGWGTANAQTVTFSFWARSSLTGTFGGALQNSANNRSYPFTFLISAANTFEYKTVTIAGDTSGTWLTDNGSGIKVRFNLGSGSTYSGTAGAWAASDFRNATGAISVLATNGATLYITGVSFEKGIVATSFDYRPYGTELVLCQRYYQKSFPIATAPAQNVGGVGAVYSQSPAPSGSAPAWVNFATVMRATPSTVTTFNPSAANANWRNLNTSTDVNVTLYASSQSSIYIAANTQTVGQYQIVAIHYTADAEL
jgi:hypothetical protein